MAAKQLRPGGERIRVVDRDAHPALEGPGVFGTRREVRRVQNALAPDLGKQLEHALDLPARDAFELDAFRAQGTQHLGVRVGLHRVMHAADGVEAAQRARRSAHHIKVIHERGVLITQGTQQLLAFTAPPGGAAVDYGRGL